MGCFQNSFQFYSNICRSHEAIQNFTKKRGLYFSIYKIIYVCGFCFLLDNDGANQKMAEEFFS